MKITIGEFGNKNQGANRGITKTPNHNPCGGGLDFVHIKPSFLLKQSILSTSNPLNIMHSELGCILFCINNRNFIQPTPEFWQITAI